MAPQYKLSYFDARYLAEPIRLIFALKEIKFEDIRLKRDEWLELKNEPQYPWGCLPVLQDGDKVLAHSGAIQRYLAKKFRLNGSSRYEAAKCDEIVETMSDFRQAYFKACFESYEFEREEMVEVLKSEIFPKYLKKFDAILRANGGYYVGTKVSYADLNIASYLQIFGENFPEALEPYANIKAHQDMVFNLSGIKEWVAKRPVTEL